MLQVTRGCEEAVRTLSASAQADVYIEAAHEGMDMNVKISRTRFEDLCFDLYKAAGGVIVKALTAAATTTDKVDMVLLAGGEICIPIIGLFLSAPPTRGGWTVLGERPVLFRCEKSKGWCFPVRGGWLGGWVVY